jgi:hypothetical protein
MVDWLTWPAELVLSAGGMLQVGSLVETRLVSWPFSWGLRCWYWRPSCPCLHICQRWLDIGGRVHKLIALFSPTAEVE